MQLNIRWHRENFGSIEEMLEPKKNIEYAASFLLTLYKKYGDWHKAVRFYHSRTAEYYRKYSRKITLAWIGDKNLNFKQQKCNNNLDYTPKL